MSIFYDKQRASDLRKFCEETLIEVIAPEVVLATGKCACQDSSLKINLHRRVESVCTHSWVLLGDYCGLWHLCLCVCDVTN